MTSQILKENELLSKALLDKGYTTANVFISDIDVKPSTDPRYEFEISVYRWNTRTAWVTNLVAKKHKDGTRYIISYYRRGNIGHIPSGVGKVSRGKKINF